MRYVEAPKEYVPGPPALFLAGGISGCHDWQAEARALLAGHNLVVFNPRAAQFDVHDPAAAPRQIAWEVRHLARADATLFWFPASDPAITVQPIALLELGLALGRGRRIAVGADPGYPRRLDVIEQTGHARPGLIVRDTLAATVTDALVLLGLAAPAHIGGREG